MTKYLLLFLALFLTAHIGFSQQRNYSKTDRNGSPQLETVGQKSFSDNDTLNFPLIGEYALYVYEDGLDGYVTGNNAYGDLAKGNYFPKIGNQHWINSLFLDFAEVSYNGIEDELLDVTIFSKDSNGKPGGVLGETQILLSEIADDLASGYASFVEFEDRIWYDGGFFVSMQLPVLDGDTIAFWSNTDGDQIPATAWDLYANGEWVPISESASLDIAIGIYPIVSESENSVIEKEALHFSFYPNPASSHIILSSENNDDDNNSVRIVNLMGKTLFSQENVKVNGLRINLSNYAEGLYFIYLKSSSETVVKKIEIVK